MNELNVLIARLDHPNANQRRMAALRLGSLRNGSVGPTLVSHIAVEPDFGVREDLTWAIVMHIDSARPAIERLLDSPLGVDRALAAHVLSKVADPGDFERVVPLVADADPEVAIKAYRAAATTGGERAVGALVVRLGDGDAAQRDALTMALVAIGRPALLAVLAGLDAESAAVRAHASEAVGHFGDTVDRDDLARLALVALTGLTTDADREVRVNAVTSLEELGEPAYPVLASLACSGDDLVSEVARRLVATRRATR